MKFLKSDKSARAVINWSDDGKEEFYAIELIVGRALHRLEKIDPGFFSEMILSENKQVREIIENYLRTEARKFPYEK